MSVEFQCRWCGDVIGVYEPLIKLVRGRPVETSRVRDPALARRRQQLWHRACYERSRAPARESGPGAGGRR